jgi:predicted transcriptional regulator
MRRNPKITKPLFFALLIPEVLNDHRLSSFDRVLLSVIIQLTKQKGLCFANNQHFALNLRCSVGTVSKSISKLHKLGYITHNFPNDHNGGRGHLRMVRDDLIYKAEKHNE